MNISVEQLCRIMEHAGIAIVERYKLLFALNEYDGYILPDHDEAFRGFPVIAEESTLTELDREQLVSEAKRLAKTGYVKYAIESRKLKEPDSLDGCF